MKLSGYHIARMIDISAVRADTCQAEVVSTIHAAIEHRFFCVYTLPSMASFARECLIGESEIYLGGTVGFPSGGNTTTAKVFEAEELLKIGCDELDMVINIGKLKSNLFHDVANDIQKVVEVAGRATVKVILEVSLLEDNEIREGAKIIRDSGAQYIKTGTGWQGTTTLEHIRLIQETVHDSIKIKVAGGVRNLQQLLKLHEMGISRFGINYKAAISILDEYQNFDKG